jgi:hypothetical protein
VLPLVGPLGGFGVETVSGAVMETLRGLEVPERTAVLTADRPRAVTWYVPAEFHVFDACAVPVGNHPESVPSPQLKMY